MYRLRIVAKVAEEGSGMSEQGNHDYHFGKTREYCRLELDCIVKSNWNVLSLTIDPII